MAVDHFSRYVVGFSVFTKKPTSRDVCAFLGRGVKKAGKAPKHIVSDREKAFDCTAYRRWCKRRGIRPRFGAVGKHGSIAVVERFIRTMKNEFTRKTKVPLRQDIMRRELIFYMAWYT